MEWCLIACGTNEEFENGLPNGNTLSYEVSFTFETLDELLKFVLLFQDKTTEFHEFKISKL